MKSIRTALNDCKVEQGSPRINLQVLPDMIADVKRHLSKLDPNEEGEVVQKLLNGEVM